MAESNFFSIYSVRGIVLSDEKKLNIIRHERNKRLQKCDWTQLSDANLTESQVQAWQEYRQALRDLPNNGSLNISNPVFPSEPTND